METQSSKSQNMREFRRLRAVELFESGMKQVDIARVLGVTKGAVSQWLSIYRENGLDISPAGRLYIQIQTDSFKGADMPSFLRHLLAHVAGKILVVWDGCPIHRSKEVKKFCLKKQMGAFGWSSFQGIVRI